MKIIEIKINTEELKRTLQEKKNKLKLEFKPFIFFAIFLLLVFYSVNYLLGFFYAIVCTLFFIFQHFKINRNRLLLIAYAFFIFSTFFLVTDKEQRSETMVNYAFLCLIVFLFLIAKEKLKERFLANE